MTSRTPKHFRSEFKGATAATVAGLLNAISPVLLFASLLGPQVVMAGFWAALVTASLVPLLLLLLRSHPAVMPTVRTASLVAYISLVVQMCQALSTTSGPGGPMTLQQLTMALAAGSVMFLVASLLVLLTGLLRWGAVFKMIPTPVTAGINYGISLMLLTLAVKTLTGRGWIAVLVAVLMLATYVIWPWCQRRISLLNALPAVIVALAAGIALMGLVNPTGFKAASATPFSVNGDWVSVWMWHQLAGQDLLKLATIGLPGAVTLALVMILEGFTSMAVMEKRFGVRVAANRELVAMGGANIFSALLGGAPCIGSALRSAASWEEGGRSTAAALLCAGLTTAAIAALGHWLVALPASLTAGLFLIQALMMMGFSFMHAVQQVAKSWRWPPRLSRDLGFWITFAITLVAFFGNLVWACFVGVGLSCLAVLRRLSINLTAQWAYLDQYHSRRVRSEGEMRNLARRPWRVGILRLTGHLFFGNSTRLTQLADDLPAEAVAVVIDVRQVQDVDPSGMEAVQWLIKSLVERKLKVVITGSRLARANPLRLGLQNTPGVQHCSDLDRGLEICEDLVLMNASILAGPLLSYPLAKNGLLTGLTPPQVSAVLMLGDMLDVPAGCELFHKGAEANGIWLLEAGVVSILVGLGDDSVRLATFGPGQFVGEMGFIDGKTRSATAWADTPVRALLLDKAAVAQLMAQHNDAALKITRNIARELSQRVRLSSALMADQTVDASAVWADHALGNPSQF